MRFSLTGLRVSLNLPYILRIRVTSAIEVKVHVTTSTAVPLLSSPPTGDASVGGADMVREGSQDI
jgi:hypothetical protein